MFLGTPCERGVCGYPKVERWRHPSPAGISGDKAGTVLLDPALAAPMSPRRSAGTLLPASSPSLPTAAAPGRRALKMWEKRWEGKFHPPSSGSRPTSPFPRRRQTWASRSGGTWKSIMENFNQASLLI